MKLRIKGNTLRLRLSRTEVENFGTDGYFEETTLFGKNKLVYAIRRTDNKLIEASFDDHKITVYIPEKISTEWVNSNMVGFKNAATASDTGLSILVEKDFKCIDTDETEDQSDNYDNPKQVC